MDGGFEIAVVDTDDDAQFAGALIDHPHVDAGPAHGFEETGGGAAVMHHAAADGRDDGHVVIDGNAAAAFHERLDLPENLHPVRLKGFALDDDAHAVDAGGHMLKGNAVVLQDLQHLAAETDFAVHHILFHGDDAVSLVAGDAGDGGNGNLIGGVFTDHGAGVIRLVGIADIGGDTGPVDREHGVLMQDGGAHMAQLPQLLIGDGGNLGRAVDNPRIGHEETGNVGPVLIHVGVNRIGNQGTGDIAAAAGEGADFTVFLRAVEAGHDGGLPVAEDGGELFRGLFGVKRSIVMEDNPVGSVHETPAQIIRHQQRTEVFPAAGAPVPPKAGGNALLHLIQTGGDIDLQVKTLGDGQIAVPDLDELIPEGFPLRGEGMTEIEQVGDLIIFRKALSGSTGDQIPAGGLQLQDAADLAELLVIGEGASAELGYDTFKHRFSSITPPQPAIGGTTTGGVRKKKHLDQPI